MLYTNSGKVRMPAGNTINESCHWIIKACLSSFLISVSAWRELPDKERLVVFLVDMRKLGIERTAEIMNKPVSIVIKETRQARELVKKKLLSNYQKIEFPKGSDSACFAVT